MERRESDRWKYYTILALMLLLFVQGLANSLLYGYVMYSFHRFNTVISIAEETFKGIGRME